MSVCYNCQGMTPYMRYITVSGKKVMACSNACTNTLRGRCGEPWRWLDKEVWETYVEEHPEYDFTDDPDPRSA